MVNVPNGGRKKKLKHSIATIDAASAGRLPQRVAMNRTLSRRASDTVAALTCAPTVLSNSVNTLALTTATTYPAHFWSNHDRCMPGILSTDYADSIINLCNPRMASCLWRSQTVRETSSD